MINEVFVSEETVALAKEKACTMLGVSEDKVDFEICQLPSKKVFGMFGGKQAQIRASLKKSIAQKAVEFLKEVLFYMGLDSLEVQVQKETTEYCEIKIVGDNLGCIVGKHGEALDSLQYLTGLVANDNSKTDLFCKIRLEAGDYREKRKQTLEILGRHIAEKALKAGRKLSLEPMRSYERKIVHSAIGNISGAKSWSEGEGTNRHVVVAPDLNS